MCKYQLQHWPLLAKHADFVGKGSGVSLGSPFWEYIAKLFEC